MKYDELKLHASECQMAADEIAHRFLEQQELFGLISVLQSHCAFNLAWLVQISPVILNLDTLKFLADNKDKIKKKLTIQQILRFDTIIKWREPKDFDEFKSMCYEGKDYDEILHSYLKANEETYKDVL